MLTETLQTGQELIGLRQEAHYWKTLHARAIEREGLWRKKACELEKIVRHEKAQTRRLTQYIEVLESRIVLLQKQVFGRKTEKTQSEVRYYRQSSSNSSDRQAKRGKRNGQKGYGRKRYANLPTEEIFHDLSEDLKQCPKCGKPFYPFPATEDSEEIHIETRLIRRIHRRKRYVPACDCSLSPGIIQAPPPAKLIPKGLFSTDFWTYILLEKFLFQRPLYRILQALKLEGLSVSQGTITGGLKRIENVFQPLYERILERSRASNHWHMDETRWFVFVAMKGKVGYGWWLWVIIAKDTCAYILYPSRSRKVPKNHLGENPKGIINADRYNAYKKLGKHILIAYCWGHVRRDYIRIRAGHRKFTKWAEGWIARINELFRLNKERLKVLSKPREFHIADQALHNALSSMKEAWSHELKDNALHPAKKRALNSLREHWNGLTLFKDHPQIPMDNNLSERQLRNPVVGRKNYYGCSSLWSGRLTAALFTILQTLLLNNINPKKFLKIYLESCAQNHGRPPENIDDFLPWDMPKEHKSALGYGERSP